MIFALSTNKKHVVARVCRNLARRARVGSEIHDVFRNSTQSLTFSGADSVSLLGTWTRKPRLASLLPVGALYIFD
jgi:hypothetical protein